MTTWISIGKTVGHNGANAAIDVMSVQLMLNHFSRNKWFYAKKELNVDGDCGDMTRKRILAFQDTLVQPEGAVGLLRPAGPTINYMNKYCERVNLGLGPPPSPPVPKPVPSRPIKPEPPNFLRTIWPIPTLRGSYTGTRRAAPPPTPPATALKINFGSFETRVVEYRDMAFQIAFEGVAEVKSAQGQRKDVENHVATSLAHWVAKAKNPGASDAEIWEETYKVREGFAGGRTVELGPDGRKLGQKFEYAFNRMVKAELASNWTVTDFRKFEEAAIQGDIKKLGGELAAAKLSFSFFKWLEAEAALTAEFPCPFGVQGKLILNAPELLFALDAPRNFREAAKESKIEVAVTLKIGLSERAWQKTGRRLGKRVLERSFKEAGLKVFQAFGKFAQRLSILTMAVEFVGYEIALFEHLVRQAKESGTWEAQMADYTLAYVYTAGYRSALIPPSQNPDQKVAFDAGRHDAELAIKKWGVNTVARALVEKFTTNPEAHADPLGYLHGPVNGDKYNPSRNELSAVSEQFMYWIKANPHTIERQLKHSIRFNSQPINVYK